MSNALHIPVKESLIELRNHLKNAIPMIQPRIKMLILMKKSGEKALSKRDLMESLGVSSQSIQDWRSAYKTGGIELLMSPKRNILSWNRSYETPKMVWRVM